MDKRNYGVFSDEFETFPGNKESEVRKGRCKWFNVVKGWGFITPIEGGEEVFVHQSVIRMAGLRSLAEQELVEYICHRTERGLEASLVRGPGGLELAGTRIKKKNKINHKRRYRCYNCGEYNNHLAQQCILEPQPRRCHFCKSGEHLMVDCPTKTEEI